MQISAVQKDKVQLLTSSDSAPDMFISQGVVRERARKRIKIEK